MFLQKFTPNDSEECYESKYLLLSKNTDLESTHWSNISRNQNQKQEYTNVEASLALGGSINLSDSILQEIWNSDTSIPHI